MSSWKGLHNLEKVLRYYPGFFISWNIMGKYISVSEKEWNGLQMKVPSQSTSQQQSVIQVLDKVITCDIIRLISDSQIISKIKFHSFIVLFYYGISSESIIRFIILQVSRRKNLYIQDRSRLSISEIFRDSYSTLNTIN